MNIQPIVEGHGEVEAVPVLLRRLQAEAQAYGIGFGRPIRRHSSDLYNREKFQRALRLALQQESCGAVLILFDLEDGCPKEKVAELRQWVQEVNAPVPCEIVLAYREFESWLLAAGESLRDSAGISIAATNNERSETRRNAKGALEEWMAANRSYAETVDQAPLTARFDMAIAHRYNRSFRRMVNAFGQLVRGMGQALEEWPPPTWEASVDE